MKRAARHPLPFAPTFARDLFGAGVLLVPLALVALAAQVSSDGALVSAATLMLISLIAVAGVQVYSGNSGVISFGHVAFMGLGAYFAAWLTLPSSMKARMLPDLPALLSGAELDMLVAVFPAVAAVACAALAVGLTIARLDGAAGAIATLGLLVIVYSLLIGAQGLTRGSQALFGLPLSVDLWTAFVCAAVAVVLARLYRGSNAGLQLRASREDEPAALACGIDVVRRRLGAWVLSAALAGLAGVLYGHYLGVLTPRAFYFNMTFSLLAMLIVGGMTTVTGAVAGTFVVSLIVEGLRRFEQVGTIGGVTMPELHGLTTIGLSVAILAVMYKLRSGLTGYLEIDERWRRARAGRATVGAAAPTPADSAGTSGTGIACRGLVKRFGGVTAVADVSLDLRPGEILGLIGPNGAGKSTLLALVSGTLTPSGGKVAIDETDVTGWPSYRIARCGLARTFQNIRLFQHLSVRENVEVAATLNAAGAIDPRAEAAPAVDALLARFDLAELAGRPAGTLAYGPQRRLEIARAAAMRPRYLLLDEPAAGMNQTESDALLRMLQALRAETGIGLLVVDHDLRLIMRLCERVVVMNKGRVIAEGPPETVQTDPNVVEAYLGRRARGGASAAEDRAETASSQE